MTSKCNYHIVDCSNDLLVVNDQDNNQIAQCRGDRSRITANARLIVTALTLYETMREEDRTK